MFVNIFCLHLRQRAKCDVHWPTRIAQADCTCQQPSQDNLKPELPPLSSVGLQAFRYDSRTVHALATAVVLRHRLVGTKVIASCSLAFE